MEHLWRGVINLFHRVEQQHAFQSDHTGPNEIGFGFFQAAGNRAEVAVTEFPLQIQDLTQTSLFGNVARTHRHEMRSWEFGCHDGDGFGRLGASVQSIEHHVWKRHLWYVTSGPGREVHVVFGQAGDAKCVMNQNLVVALGHAHGRQNIGRGVGTDQQINLVNGDDLFVQGARQVGPGLVVFEHPLDRATQQTVFLVQLFNVNFADQLVYQGGGRQRACQGQGATHFDGRT